MGAQQTVSEQDLRERFCSENRTHVLMITNHGVHQWQVIPGLPDTGGQNVYVNQFAETLVDQGFRVTIANRGGYPHPVTGDMHSGVVYHPSGFARVLYVEDGRGEFIRKEDMDEQLPALARDLANKLQAEGNSSDLIISHYWDAGKLGILFEQAVGRNLPHLWVPHSLGALKKRNMDPSTWKGLRIDERIANERLVLDSIEGAVATSEAIRETLLQDYAYETKFFLPPCVDADRYRPRSADEMESIWPFLAEHSAWNIEQLKGRKIITEISRTDPTKRKDVLIKALAQVKQRVPEALLVVSIDPLAEKLCDSLHALIGELGLERDVIVVGSVWDELPFIYNATSVYCTPSVMEGFGMSAEEAAASGVPIVSSNLVPFVCEYLLGNEPQRIDVNHKDNHHLLFGDAGVAVPADYVEGFAEALVRLLTDDELRGQMGERARHITVPYFTWRHQTETLLRQLGVTPTTTEVERV